MSGHDTIGWHCSEVKQITGLLHFSYFFDRCRYGISNSEGDFVRKLWRIATNITTLLHRKPLAMVAIIMLNAEVKERTSPLSILHRKQRKLSKY